VNTPPGSGGRGRRADPGRADPGDRHLARLVPGGPRLDPLTAPAPFPLTQIVRLQKFVLGDGREVKFEARVGINTGEASGGIVGKKRKLMTLIGERQGARHRQHRSSPTATASPTASAAAHLTAPTTLARRGHPEHGGTDGE